MTVIDLTSSMEENAMTQQGIMEAQETNEDIQSVAPVTNTTEVFNPSKRCTKLPSSVVSRDTCGYFDLINEIRKNPTKFISVLEDRLEKVQPDVALSISRIASSIGDDEKTPEKVMETERAIQVLRRSNPVSELEWSDALFLSADYHCKT